MFLLPVKGAVNGRLVTRGFVLTLRFDYSFTVFWAGVGVGSVGSGAVDTLEVGTEEFFVQHFLVSMYLDTFKAGGVVEILVVFSRTTK